MHIASGLKKPLLGIYNPDKENYLAWHLNSDKAISFSTDEILPYDINQLNKDSLQKALKDHITFLIKVPNAIADLIT